jgi:hypothetical protein
LVRCALSSRFRWPRPKIDEIPCIFPCLTREIAPETGSLETARSARPESDRHRNVPSRSHVRPTLCWTWLAAVSEIRPRRRHCVGKSGPAASRQFDSAHLSQAWILDRVMLFARIVSAESLNLTVPTMGRVKYIYPWTKIDRSVAIFDIPMTSLQSDLRDVVTGTLA